MDDLTLYLVQMALIQYFGGGFILAVAVWSAMNWRVDLRMAFILFFGWPVLSFWVVYELLKESQCKTSKSLQCFLSFL